MSLSRTSLYRPAAFAVVVVFLFGAAASARAAQTGKARENVYTRLLKSTAYVMSPANAGTAWVCDRENGLLVTNYHVVDNHETGQIRDKMDVIFPVYENGRVVAEQSSYFSHEAELRASGRWVEAQVIDAQPSIDLALLKVAHLPDDVAAVPLADDSPLPSDHLHSIGNPGGSKALWLYTLGEVKQVSRQSFTCPIGHRFVTIDARVIETQSPTNHGDSGGPVVNDAGELVGVTQSCSAESSLLNIDIDVSEVRAFLAANAWMGKVVTADDYARRGRHYFADVYFAARSPRNNRLGPALADMNEAIRRDPNRADYYLDRARIYEERGLLATIASASPVVTRFGTRGKLPPADLVAAESDVRAALRLAPKNARAHARLASIYNVTGQDSLRAVEELKTAVSLDGNCVDAYELMSTLAASKDARLAIRYLNDVLRIQADDAGALASRAEAYEQLANHEAALRDYDAALRLSPNSARFHRGRAAVYRKLNKLDEAARDMVETTTQLEPESVANWLELGRFLVDNGLVKQAIVIYSAGLEVVEQLHLETGSPELLAARGKAYAAGGDAEHARQDWLSALRLAKAATVRDIRFEEELTQDIQKLESVSVNN